MKNKRQKLIVFVVAVVLAFATFSAFSGCHFVQRDDLRDLRQVVARAVHGEGENQETIYIYKWQLIQAINQAMQGQQRMPTEAEINQIIDNIIDQRIIEIEMLRMFDSRELIFRDGRLGNHPEGHPNAGEPICSMYGMEGDCFYCEIDPVLGNTDYTDINQVRRVLFNSIDQELASIRNQILSQRDHDLPAENEPPAQLPQPEFPVRPDVVENNHTPELELFVPARELIPGTQGGAERRSLETEALRRFASSILNTVEGSVREPDTTALEADRVAIADFKRARDYEGLYLWLVDYSYSIQFIGGEDIKLQTQQAILQRHLAQGVTVSEQDVEARFRGQLDMQRWQFSADAQAYASAVSGNQRILFRPNSNFFYVKHVLLPFSDAQTSQLQAFRARPQGYTSADLTNFRDVQLVNDIRVHRRDAQGFPNLEREYTVNEVLAEIMREVDALSNQRDAHRRFRDYIYMFNTDPGAFTHFLGYAMPHDTEADTGFMPEFAVGGWEVRDLYIANRQAGLTTRVLPRPAVTDFGVHIMFYSYNPPANYVARLTSFSTPSEEQTWFEVFYDEIRGERQADEFGRWARARILEFRRDTQDIVIYRRRFRDLRE